MAGSSLKTKIPKEIIVGPYTIQVRIIPGMQEDMECKGDFSSTYYRIRLDADLVSTPVNMLEVCLHEIYDAIYHVYGISTMIDEGDREEKIVSLVSIAFLKMLQDNPEVLSLINSILSF